MSLVDYASSDEDDDVLEDPVVDKHEKPSNNPQPSPLKLSDSNQQPESADSLELPAVEKLPDALELLNSSASDFSSSNALSGGTDHSSRVAAAMAQSASSRKRDSIGLASSVPRSKVPKGSLPYSKNVPETVGGVLVPPQLRGRSNIVTEDINKLFVKKLAEPSSKVEVPQISDD